MPTRAQLSAAEEYKGGHTPLMRAALAGQTEAVKALVTRGEDVNAKDDEGRTALMFAVTNMKTDCVDLLLSHGADVNTTANDGSTALMLAAAVGDSGIVRVLLSKGAHVSGKFIETGKTALTLAREREYTEIVELLQAAGAEQ